MQSILLPIVLKFVVFCWYLVSFLLLHFCRERPNCKWRFFRYETRNLRLGFQSFLYWCANWIPFCWNAHLSFIKEFFFITLSNTGCLKLFLWRNVFFIIYGFMTIFFQKKTWIPCRNCFYWMGKIILDFMWNGKSGFFLFSLFCIYLSNWVL